MANKEILVSDWLIGQKLIRKYPVAKLKLFINILMITGHYVMPYQAHVLLPWSLNLMIM